LLEADIRDLPACRESVAQVDHVLHQAALASVPGSILDPVSFNATNVDGFLNMLVAAKDAQVRSFVYASSSASYGDDHPDLPKVEERSGSPLSPYALGKLVNELYAEVFRRCYEFPSVGLRYFNIFGPRQSPGGAYAAVIPKWTASMITGDPITINGDGQTTRDFCYVANAVQANLLAAFAGPEAQGQVFNVAVGAGQSLNQLFYKLKQTLAAFDVSYQHLPRYGPFRDGDIRHSEADISKATRLLEYWPTHDLDQGLKAAVPWFLQSDRPQPTFSGSPAKTGKALHEA
jgi:UDP-N-acetylglucosamine 4-epimerase